MERAKALRSHTHNFADVIYLQSGAEKAASITPATIYYKWGHAYRYGINTTPGTTDMTTALNNSLLQSYQSGGSDPYWPTDTYSVSDFTISSPTRVTTDGLGTVIQQKSGVTVDTPIFNIQSSDVYMERFTATGNISTDSSEHMHVAQIGGNGTYSRVVLEGITASNIRGDVVYLGGTASNPLYDVHLGEINGTNIYRNIVSFVGVEGCEVDSITGTQIGYRGEDVEPNVGNQIPDNIHIKYFRGANLNFAGALASIGRVVIDFADLDNSLIADSSPAYPLYPGSSGNIGIIAGNISSLHIGSLKARNYGERLLNCTGSTIACSIVLDRVDISGCNTTETTYKTLFNLDAKATLEINGGTIVLAGAADRYIVKHATGGVHRLRNLTISGGAIAATGDGCTYENLTIDAGSYASLLFASINTSSFKSVNLTNDGSATLQYSCQHNSWRDSSSSPATVNGGSSGPHTYLNCTIGGNYYRINGPEGVVAFNPGTINAGARVKTTITVTGAAIGDYAFCSFLDNPTNFDDVTMTAKVTSANTVTVIFQNTGGSNVAFGNNTLRAWVSKST